LNKARKQIYIGAIDPTQNLNVDFSATYATREHCHANHSSSDRHPHPTDVIGRQKQLNDARSFMRNLCPANLAGFSVKDSAYFPSFFIEAQAQESLRNLKATWLP
jgi:hypothetical protein